MKGLLSRCDAGCGNTFTIDQIKTQRLSGGIDKVYFVCPHCNHEYVSHYTDAEIRNIQARIRRAHMVFASLGPDHTKEAKRKVAKREAELKQQIKEKMDTLRAKIERGDLS